jgi:hypothetical protein
MIPLQVSALEDSGGMSGVLPNTCDERGECLVDVMTVLQELERGTLTVDEAMLLLDDVE